MSRHWLARRAAVTTRPAIGQVLVTSGPLGFGEAENDGRGDERDAEPAEDSEQLVSRSAPPPFGVHRLGREEQTERDETQVDTRCAWCR